MNGRNGKALLDAMRATFGEDRRRIDHALAVLGFADRILEDETNADALVVHAAAVLHDIGIHAAERKHGSAAGRFQEIEGPPIARRIMEEQGLPAEAIEHVCRIVGSHHSAGDIDTVEFRIVWDADWLVNLEAESVFENKNRNQRREVMTRVFRTERGRRLAEEKYL